MNNFMIVEADTAELRDLCYRLRYQVYCLENAFEDPDENREGLETDPYDETSVHSLVIHRPTGMAVGTVRLILPSPELTPALPFLAATAPKDETAKNGHLLQQAAEISRFAISKEFRRLAITHLRRRSSVAQEALPRHSQITGGSADHITLALVRGFLQLAAKHEVLFLYALMERGLLRRAEKLGLHFHVTGPAVAFHGWRQPTITNILELLDRAKTERYDVWSLITDDGDLLPSFSKLLAAE